MDLQPDLIFDVGEAGVTAIGTGEFADRILQPLAGAVCADRAFLLVKNSETVPHVLYPYGFINSPEFTAWCASQCEGISVEDAEETHMQWEPERTLSVYPLRGESEMIGLLGISPAPKVSSESWERLLTVLSAALARLGHQSELTRKVNFLNTYLTVSSMLAQSMGLHEMLETALYCCMEITQSEAATVLLLDEEKENFEFYQIEGPAKPVLMMAVFPANQGIAGAVLKSQQAEVINEARTDPRLFKQIDDSTGFFTRNMIAIPLTAGKEKIGVLEVLNKADQMMYTEDELLSLMLIAEEISFAIRNAIIFEYVADSYCLIRQGIPSCKGCKRPLGTWTPCVRYREAEV